MESHVTFTVANKYAELDRIAAEVAKFCGNYENLVTLENRLLLVLEELFSNTIDYGYAEKDPSSHETVIKLSISENTLHVVYEDDARPFDPTLARPINMTGTVEDRPVGGLGIHLVTTIMSSVDYEHIESRNRLTMKMTIPT